MSADERRSPYVAGGPCRDPKCGFCSYLTGGHPVRLLDTSGKPIEIVGNKIGSVAGPAGAETINATAALTADERQALRSTALSYRSAAELIEEAIATGEGKGRVDLALGALGFAGRVGATAAGVAAIIGKGR